LFLLEQGLENIISDEKKKFSVWKREQEKVAYKVEKLASINLRKKNTMTTRVT
jgi:hypothetical protein